MFCRLIGSAHTMLGAITGAAIFSVLSACQLHGHTPTTTTLTQSFPGPSSRRTLRSHGFHIRTPEAYIAADHLVLQSAWYKFSSSAEGSVRLRNGWKNSCVD